MIKITKSDFNFEVFSGEGIFNIDNIEGKFVFIFDTDLQLKVNFNKKDIDEYSMRAIKLDIANHLKEIYKKYIKGL